MKKIFTFLVLSLFLMSACASNAPEDIAGDMADDSVEIPEDNVVEEDTGVVPEEEEVMEEEIPEEESEPVVLEMDDEIKEILTKGETKIKGYSYVYHGPPEEQKGYAHFILGDMGKIELPKAQVYKEEGRYDSVYFHIGKETAVGICESLDCSDRKSIIDLDYEEQHMKRPMEWLDEVVTAEKIREEQNRDRQPVVVLKVKFKDGKEGEMHVWDYWGIPTYVKVGGTEYTYEKTAINAVKSEKVQPPQEV